MSILIAGLIIFFTLHSVSIINEGWRNRMVASIGEGPWKGLYALVALLGFVLMVWGYGLARQDSAVLYSSAHWLRHLVMLLLLPVFPLLLTTYFPGRIKALAKNPMLIATILWSFAHLLVNGRLVDVLLFGAFLVWAALDLYSMRRRVPRTLPGAPIAKVNDVIALTLGLGLYGLFIVWLHGLLIGVALISPIS
ncbi:NnrU family protein [Geopsychrobacter electrodiphilus]|uniref:NnrU family protein n=1 Tax=Geopsychrobacter electrodiphilus TaxID=225196 RepID=UPI000370BB7B|nr:NnrU family protein [Geopsychrobacter electrodiphilus]